LTLRYRKVYSKRNNTWSAVPVRAVKKFPYRVDLFIDMIQRRLNRRESIALPMEMEEDDPRRIAPNISAVPSPPMGELVALKQSRFESFES
jgi:hypothetical protein